MPAERIARRVEVEVAVVEVVAAVRQTLEPCSTLEKIQQAEYTFSELKWQTTTTLHSHGLVVVSQVFSIA